jgi:hypothetical protein
VPEAPNVDNDFRSNECEPGWVSIGPEKQGFSECGNRRNRARLSLDILTGNLGLVHARGMVPFAHAHTLPRTSVVGIGERETALPRGYGAG